MHIALRLSDGQVSAATVDRSTMNLTLFRSRKVPGDPGDRGASMVEFAIVVPVFIAVIMAIIDFSGAIFARNELGAGAANGARQGTIAEQAEGADAAILKQIRTSTDLMVNATVNRVVVYAATSTEEPPSQACQTGSGDPSCVIYSGQALQATSPDCPKGAWCADRRFSNDLIGVWISAEYRPITGLTPIRFTWDDQAVALIEPQVQR